MRAAGYQQTLTGIDFSTVAVEAMSSQWAKLGEARMSCLAMDAAHMSEFAAESFDIVIEKVPLALLHFLSFTCLPRFPPVTTTVAIATRQPSTPS